MNPENLEAKIARVLRDAVEIVPYDPRWPEMAEAERRFLTERFPPELVRRVEHFGSTAVPGLAAKPIVDLLVEVSSLERAKAEIVPALEAIGYDYFWRPTHGEDGPPFYAWFIKRDEHGRRTHHLHLVEAHFEHWERLVFRDHLRLHPEEAARYGALKARLAVEFRNDRSGYTAHKRDYIAEVTQRAKEALRR